MLPFELQRARQGRWSARWDAEKIGVAVAGSDDAPHPRHLETLRDLVARWPAVRRELEAWLAALPADTPILQRASRKPWWSAGDSGFDDDLVYQGLGVMDLDAPTRATVTFYTGFPDGYATYELVLDAGRPVEVLAFAS